VKVANLAHNSHNHRSNLIFGVVACPAQFERATYGLEGVKIYLKQRLNNVLQFLKFGLAYAV
jgi:hypothetical protein